MNRLLITKQVEVNLVGRNINYYVELGLISDRKRGKITVAIDKLSPHSCAEVEIKCDYCNKFFSRKFSVHTSIKDKNYNIKKDACWNCNGKKQQEERSTKIDKIDKDENNGYWSFKKNRMSELKIYIVKHGNIDSLYSTSKESRNLYLAFKRHNHDIIQASKELGYNIYEIMTRFPNGYYDDINNVLKRLKYFMKEYGKFPTQIEMLKSLNISCAQISKHGGIHALKKILNIDDNLRDDNGFYNSSSYEYCVAQYLTHNSKIKYLREQSPFPKTEGKFRSDFMFTLENRENIFIEVWGNIGDQYEVVKNKKLALYNKYNLKVISINSDIFYCKMDTIQDKLYEILSPYIELKTIQIDGSLLYNYDSLSDIELLNEIMSYSTDETTLPSSKLLKDSGKYCLYHNASKRYGSYHEFGNCMGLKTDKKNQGYWSIDNMYKEALNAISSGIPLDRDSLKIAGISGLEVQMSKYSGGTIQFRLDFYNLFLQKLGYKLIDSEKAFVTKIAENRGTNIKGKVSIEQQKMARNILQQLKKVS